MKFLLAQRQTDEYEPWHDLVTFELSRPPKGAYQDTFIQRESKQIEPTITEILKYDTTHTTEEDKNIAFTVKESREITHPDAEKWLEEGYDHLFEEHEGTYPHIRVWLYMYRKVEKTGWFMDFNTLEELLAFMRNYGSFLVEINFADNFDIEPDYLPMLLVEYE